MPRCDVHLCGDPITPGRTGFICVVCEKAFCSHHSGPGCMELSCCENDQRQCELCGKVTTANDGIHVRDDFYCAKCCEMRASAA